MMTGEKWRDDPCFEGHGSTVLIVTALESYACSPLEVHVEGIGLDSFHGPMNIKIYFWDNRETSVAREYYESTFGVGSIWRVSGTIEYEENGIIFIDPVYMAYSGEKASLLKYHFPTDNSSISGT
jgi:hypothetical protein